MSQDFNRGYHPPQGAPAQPYQRARRTATHAQQYAAPEFAPPPPQQMGYQPAPPQAAPMPNVVVNVNAPVPGHQDSYFDGKLLQQIGYTILGVLVTVFTLGICYPWAFCMLYGWKAKHTVIEGRRLVFDGKAVQLLGKWILWAVLTVITFGIYAFWVGIALEKWRVKHTHFQ